MIDITPAPPGTSQPNVAPQPPANGVAKTARRWCNDPGAADLRLAGPERRTFLAPPRRGPVPRPGPMAIFQAQRHPVAADLRLAGPERRTSSPHPARRPVSRPGPDGNFPSTTTPGGSNYAWRDRTPDFPRGQSPRVDRHRGLRFRVWIAGPSFANRTYSSAAQARIALASHGSQRTAANQARHSATSYQDRIRPASPANFSNSAGSSRRDAAARASPWRGESSAWRSQQTGIGTKWRREPSSPTSSEWNDGRLHRFQLHDGDGMRSGPVECTGIEDQGFSFAMLLRLVGVAVADQVVGAAGDGLAEEAGVVAMDERDAAAGECDIPKRLWQSSPLRRWPC